MSGRSRWLFLLLTAALLGAAAWRMGWLAAPLIRDEVHYWPSALFLTEEGWPSLRRLHDYPELCTPLWLIVSGLIGRIAGLGLPGARAVSLLATLSTAAILMFAARGREARVILAGLGMLTFPYFLGLGVHLYPDALATCFTLLGLAASVRRRPWLGALFFALAVSTRQYMIAFPLGFALWEASQIMLARRGPAEADSRSHLSRMARLVQSPQICASALPLATLLAWFIFWGGFGPPGEVARQRISTAHLSRVFPQYSLYSLASVGFYFVAVRWLLLDRRLAVREWIAPSSLLLLAAIAAAFAVFPPLENIDYLPKVMGHFDRLIRWLVGSHDFSRMGIFVVFAWLAARHFRRWSLPTALLTVHVIMLSKAHFAWDKYQLPLLACFWFLVADDQPWTTRIDAIPARTRPTR
jgi:hypothetical protein